MDKPLRFAPTLTAIALASVIAGCATPQASDRLSSAGRDGSKVGLAMRALGALHANDFASAVSFGEQAVENSPNDASFRALLGNAYFGSGRFASAEAAYRDALSLNSNQPQVVLKLALVQIAQGKNGQALAFLNQARNLLEPADFGLAVALAGQPQDAVNVLEAAARQVGADARVRQNLALAHAMTGDWTAARNVASQDLSADLVDARIQEWMSFAKPSAVYDQVAALTGVRPVAADPGQPTRLALNAAGSQVAQAAPASPVAPAPVVAPAPQPEPVAQYYAPEPNTPVVQYVPEYQPPVEPAPAPRVAQAAPEPAAVPAPAPEAAPAELSGAGKLIAAAAQAVAEAPAALAEMAGFTPKAEPKKKKAAPARAALRRASLPRATGNSTAVVQLGAYGSPARVAVAWNEAARRYASLRAYAPVSARFNSPKGLVYRLSVKGFGSASQAKNLCQSLRRAGGECFVRSVAGDAPVQLASR
jgi:Flp pilus assembly protein TadD